MGKLSEETSRKPRFEGNIFYLSYLGEEYSRSGVHLTFLKQSYPNLSVEFIKLKVPLVLNICLIYKLSRKNKSNNCVFVVMSPSNISVVLLKIFSRKKIVLDAGWPISDSTELRASNAWSRVKSLILDFVSFKLSDLVLLESEEQFLYCESKFRINSKKYAVLHTGFNEIAFEKSKAEDQIIELDVKKALNFVPGSILVFFRGLDNVEAGIDNLLAAARETPNINFCIVSGNCSRLDLPKNVLLLDRWVNASELMALYNRADIVMGQLGEANRINRTIAHKIFEGAYFEKPIISSESDSLKRLFTNESSILFFNKSKGESLSELIVRLSTSRELRERLSTNIKEIYSKKLSQERISRRFLDILDSRF